MVNRNFFQVIGLILMLSISCNESADEFPEAFYRAEMRQFVIQLSSYARQMNPNFIIIPQNGVELIVPQEFEEPNASDNYLKTINGVGREDLFYGFETDNELSPNSFQSEQQPYLSVCLSHNIPVLVTDYCWDHAKMDDSYQKNDEWGFISFAASNRELNQVPDYPAKPFHENADSIFALTEAKNFLYLINTEGFTTKEDFLHTVAETNYDAIIMDLFINEVAFTKQEINQLKTKKNGGKRLVICYMSIGEAESYRYYWKSFWKTGNPTWLKTENPNWEGNFKVTYWDKNWQSIIYGNDNSYLKKLLDAEFDGVYLDLIDAFEYFE